MWWQWSTLPIQRLKPHLRLQIRLRFVVTHKRTCIIVTLSYLVEIPVPSQNAGERVVQFVKQREFKIRPDVPKEIDDLTFQLLDIDYTRLTPNSAATNTQQQVFPFEQNGTEQSLLNYTFFGRRNSQSKLLE